MDTKCERNTFLKQRIFEMIMVVGALLSGSAFACYHLKFGQLPLEEIREYFLLKNDGVVFNDFGFVFIDYAKLIAIIILFDVFDCLKYMGKLLMVGVLFGYGYIMTALYASMRVEECIPFIVILALQGGILVSFMLDLCSYKETTNIRKSTNVLMLDGVKGTVVCISITILNLISRINILK